MRAWVFAAVLLVGCVPRAVQERLVALETRVGVLETQVAQAGPAVADAQADAVLAQRYEEAMALLASGDAQGSKGVLTQTIREYPRHPSIARFQGVLDELDVVGKPAGDLSGVTEWIQGDADLSTGRHLVVFFETWCPHCRREVPMVDDRLAGRDASALLLTRLSRGGTLEQTREFLDENDVDAPVAYENGDIATRFGVRGIPAAAIVEDGVIVWRGHPARLEGDLLDQYLPAL